MDKTLTERTASLTDAAALLRKGADLTRADSVVRSGVEKRCQPFLAAGWDGVPAEVLEAAESAERDLYDDDLRKIQSHIDRELREINRECQERLAAAEQVGPEPALHGASEEVRLLAKLTGDNQKAAALTLLSGRSIGYVRQQYAQARDEDNRELVRLVEDQIGRGFVDLRLTPDRTDASELMALRVLVRERRTARAQQRDPEAVTARQRLTEMRSATVDSLLRHVRSGRGIARRPHGRPIKVPIHG
jgi:hypothetical protein